MSDRYDEKRRDFLKSVLRWTVAGGAVAGVGALAAKKGGETCVNQGVCSGCGIFDGCGLPQALSAKEARKEGQRAG
jgi:hypothetical protein